MMEWQWRQLDHMQIICTSLQTDNHSSTSPLSFDRLDTLPATQETASKQRRHLVKQKLKALVAVGNVLLSGIIRRLTMVTKVGSVTPCFLPHAGSGAVSK